MYRLPLRLVRSSTFRLSLLYVLLFALSMTAVLGFVYANTVGTMVRITDETIQRERDDLMNDYRRGGNWRLERIIQKRLETDHLRGWVYLLVDEAYAPIAGNLPQWPVDARRDGRWITFAMQRPQGSYQIRALAVPLDRGQVLLVGMDVHAGQTFRDTMIQAALGGLLLTLGLGMGGGIFMSRNMLRRINVIDRSAQRIMSGKLSSRIPVVGSGDEFDRLTNTLNAMLNEIERLIASIRNVTTSLAHDMRSPLTRIKSRLELALASDNNAEQLRDEIQYTIGESDQLLATFNAILSIAEAEGGTARDNFIPVDLWDVAGDVAELYQPIAEDRGLYLSLEGEGGSTIIGHRQMLLQALLNLVDNAIKYTEHGGITLRIERAARTITLVVADTGPGIAPADRARVLERFVRLDPARTTRGNGLGLSLVAAIARLHDAQLELGGDTGLEVKLQFSRAL